MRYRYYKRISTAAKNKHVLSLIYRKKDMDKTYEYLSKNIKPGKWLKAKNNNPSWFYELSDTEAFENLL